MIAMKTTVNATPTSHSPGVAPHTRHTGFRSRTRINASVSVMLLLSTRGGRGNIRLRERSALQVLFPTAMGGNTYVTDGRWHDGSGLVVRIERGRSGMATLAGLDLGQRVE